MEENRQLKSRLAQQEVIISEAGSIAEASLKLSGVFEAAQEAADRYVASVKRLYARAEADGGEPAAGDAQPANTQSLSATPPTHVANAAKAGDLT